MAVAVVAAVVVAVVVAVAVVEAALKRDINIMRRGICLGLDR